MTFYFRQAVLLLCATYSASMIAQPPHDGDPDLQFGVAGYVGYTFPQGEYVSHAGVMQSAMQADGKLLLAAGRLTGLGASDFGVMRLLPDGAVDHGFAVNGAATVIFPGAESAASAIAVDPASGKIILAGIVNEPATGDDFAVARLTISGTLDATFGKNGSGTTTIGFNLADCSESSACDDRLVSTSLQSDGKILLAGFSNSPTGQLVSVARLTTDGSRDTSFHSAGFVSFGFGTASAQGQRIKQLSDHSHILLIGAAASQSDINNVDFALAKFDSLGNFDTSFGVGGKVTYAFDIGGDKRDVGTDFVELPDGKILACGQATVLSPSNTDFACMRFLQNGTPDPEFMPAIIPFDVGGDLADGASVVQEDSQHRFVLAGYATDASGREMAVARIDSQGRFDPTFGMNGIITFPAPYHDAIAYGVSIQPDEKIIVAGISTVDSQNIDFEVVRILGDTIFSTGFESP